jgi:hypothetical protein
MFCDCFTSHTTARELMEMCSVECSFIDQPVRKAIMSFTCVHGRAHRHSVYPGNEDWQLVVIDLKGVAA